MSPVPQDAQRVRVDPRNPGEFFACCGLLELADRLWGAEASFKDGCFQILTAGNVLNALRLLVAQEATEVTRLDNGLEVKPLIAPLRVVLPAEEPVSLTLDAWMRVGLERGEATVVANPPWNFWSGQQTSWRIWSALRQALKDQLDKNSLSVADLFSHRLPLSGRFGFDPGAAWNALDVGFSPNEQKMDVASSPAVEMLAAVGIQRFQPWLHPDRDAFDYATWGEPLPPSVACAAAACAVTVPPSVRYRGRVIARGSYAALAYSTPLTRSEQ